MMMHIYRKVQHLEAELETFEDKLLLAAQKLDVVRNDGSRDIREAPRKDFTCSPGILP